MKNAWEKFGPGIFSNPSIGSDLFYASSCGNKFIDVVYHSYKSLGHFVCRAIENGQTIHFHESPDVVEAKSWIAGFSPRPFLF